MQIAVLEVSQSLGSDRYLDKWHPILQAGFHTEKIHILLDATAKPGYKRL
ncbi:MAG: hypothetical protein AB1861_17530 [Cyanobacteriota bacterium]